MGEFRKKNRLPRIAGSLTYDPKGTVFSMTTVDLTITAGRESVGEPWIWRIGQEFRVKVNVKRANIDADYGWVHLELEGPVEEIQRATAWLMTTGLHVEALQRAVGA